MKYSFLLLFVSIFLISAGRVKKIENPKPKALVNYYDSTFVFNGEKRKVPRFPKEYKFVQVNNIPPRFQWNGNNGYCGETCIITAGLYYGQYVSQYDVRHLSLVADYPDSIKSHSQDDQISFDNPPSQSNAVKASHMLKLTTNAFSTNKKEEYICWIKKNVALGYPVMIGVLNNVIALGEASSVDSGDTQYDHIVPVIGFASKKPLLNKNLEAEYNSEDIILFSDNGIYTPDCPSIQCVPSPSYCAQYYFHAKIDTFFKTRVQANERGIYALQKTLCDNCYLYGVGFTGIQQEKGHRFFPVRVSTSLNYEAGCNTIIPPNYTGSDTCCMYQGPAFGQGTQNKKPKPGSFTLTVTVSGLEKGKEYVLMRYENNKSIPDKPVEKQWFKALSDKHVLKRHLSSSYDQVYYRVEEKR